jgi:uncharacterized Zn finger protein
MATTSLPATRIGRGIQLHREHGDEITHEGRGVYTVPGCSEGSGSYTVNLAVFGGEESCDCPDRALGSAPVCKHLVAATVYRAKITARRRGEAVPEAGTQGRTRQPRSSGAAAGGLAEGGDE